MVSTPQKLQSGLHGGREVCCKWTRVVLMVRRLEKVACIGTQAQKPNVTTSRRRLIVVRALQPPELASRGRAPCQLSELHA
jgi:hypothetical protein